MVQKQYRFQAQIYGNVLPSNIKGSENLKILKSNIESWKPENCPCRLCSLNLADIGFIELQLVLLINYNLF